MIRSDLHIHTRYCHGHGEPIDFVQEALCRGAKGIGLLGHSRCTHGCEYAMSPEQEQTLFHLTTRLKEEYQGTLSIFRGIELDYLCSEHPLPYDYRIGSVHYIPHGDICIPVDFTRKELEAAIRDVYHGDPRQLVVDYYRIVADVGSVTHADIVGHFDLITKFNEFDPLFDDRDPVIQQAALRAMETLVNQDRLFEINTGAISRGCRFTPYPARWLLEALHEMGGRIILSSDAHQPEHILFQFEQCASLAKACGFTHAWELTTEGFCPTPL